jgi:hypothetical protein
MVAKPHAKRCFGYLQSMRGQQHLVYSARPATVQPVKALLAASISIFLRDCGRTFFEALKTIFGRKPPPDVPFLDVTLVAHGWHDLQAAEAAAALFRTWGAEQLHTRLARVETLCQLPPRSLCADALPQPVHAGQHAWRV